jgi:propionyl-CoA carboxylase alpha chain
MGIRCVAVYVDADSRSPHVTDADEAVRLSGGYLDIEGIVGAAVAGGVEAIHPGYGFLSENARFARAVVEAGIAWVGPSPAVIEAMGDKLAAKAMAQSVDVPTLPSSADVAEHPKVGFPLLVKAAAGGGGKGMRLVEAASDLKEAISASRREAESAFGDDRVFIERYVPRSRHVEIQILGDSHGNLVHLGERECSIQRRHQKVVEESPSPIVDESLRRAMGAAALRLAGAMSYESAGTVEFLVDEDTHEFFFLEVNTRLQVEHPVTEEVSGVDLVREQLRIASGESVGVDAAALRPDVHAIEVRLYAEDPESGFLPSPGTVVAFELPASPDVRWETGVAAGSVVGVEFDPMLAKVIAHGPTRTEAAAKLALALEKLHLGGITTNRDFLVATLRHPAFLAGDTTTDFIERVGPARSLRLSEFERMQVLAASALWKQGLNRREAKVLSGVPSGWRNGRLPDQQVTLAIGGDKTVMAYRRLPDGSFLVRTDEDSVPWRASVHDWRTDQIDLEVEGRRMLHAITESGDRLFVQSARGTIEVVVVPRFEVPGSAGPAGALLAPMPGTVLDVRVSPQERVTAGQILVVLEAMKMEHHMTASADGVVKELRIVPGQQVQTGALLLVLEGGDPSSDGALHE